MAYFLPSFFQKRLLRYALSRLEFVDTEALDLDSLGIRWGQRSTVELRDIGLRLEKLASFLHLPPSSELLSARVRYLQITVPADFYSSGIICQASGIDVHLRLPSEETCHGESTEQGKSPSAGDHDLSLDPILPNPTDLAQSFLEAEPKEEKEELQAAISSRSQVLQRPSSSFSSDDEDELGLGSEGVSLPSFVAAFIKGVVERLQVQIDDISVRVELETKQEGPLKRQPEEKPDSITGLLSIRQIKVNAVSASSGSDEALSCTGKRLVSLSDLNLALISEPIVFSNYARFTEPPLSPSTPVQPKSSRSPSRAPSPSPAVPSSSNSTLDLSRSTILDQPLQEFAVSRNDDRGDAPELEGSVYTYDGRFSDADTEENRSYGYLEDSQNLSDDDRLLDNPAYLDSVINSQFQDDDLENSGNLHLPPNNSNDSSRGETPRRQSPELSHSGSASLHSSGRQALVPFRQRPEHHGDISPSGSDHYHLEGVGAPQKALPEIAFGDAPQNDNGEARHISGPPSEAGSTDSASGSFHDADLSESKLFSNEEAQSMYMSAISQGSTARSFMPNIPGAWDSPESTIIKETSAQHPFHTSGDYDQAGYDNSDQDEAAAATPKLTAHVVPSMPREHSLDDSSRAPSETTEQGSMSSSQGLNKPVETAKKFFSVDKILIWIPSTTEDDELSDLEGRTGETLKESTARARGHGTDDDLLASRAHTSLRFRGDSIGSSLHSEIAESRYPQRAEQDEQEFGSGGERDEVAVEIFSAELQFDIAIGWLLVKFGQRVLHAFGQDDSAAPAKKQTKDETQGRQAVRLALQKLSIKFIGHVPGHAYPCEESQLHSPTFLSLLREDIVLQTTAAGLKAHYSTEKDKTKLRLDVTKFTLGFASEDLLSFSEDLKMRESTRDVYSPMHGDLSIALSKSSDSAHINITTLPLLFNVNVQRLEEVIDWVGGLSTILDLGSSISSMSATKVSKKDTPKRTRGVRFEASSPPTPEVSPNDSVPWKVNARVRGVAVDVAGETHYLKLRSTAVKLVSRSEGIAVQIDKAKLSGPLPLEDTKDAPAKVNLNNIRVEYLYAPKETDLDRLLSLITPSKDKYDEDDDIMLDTLFRQRRQGSVLRTTVGGIKTVITRTNDLEAFVQLGEELGRLSTVAKYLPEDDRPGLLTLTLIRDLEVQVRVGGKVGEMTARLEDAEAAYISIPSLIAAKVGSMTVLRNGHEELLGEGLPPNMGQSSVSQTEHPVLMARFIADEMEPTFKIKLHNLRVEYTLSSIVAFLGLSEEMTTGDVAANMANSLANLAELQPPHHYDKEKANEETPKAPSKPTKLAVALGDCVVGLNPRGTAAKGLVVLTNATFSGTIHDDISSEATLDLRKASIMIIDDTKNVGLADTHSRRVSGLQNDQVQTLIDLGFVSVCSISSATATLKIVQLSDDGTKSLDVELRDDLLILETCADSTQTLISIVNGLQPPTPPSVAVKYRTEVLPIQDMLASFSGDAFTMDPIAEAEETSEPDDRPHPTEESHSGADPIEDELEYVSDFYPVKPAPEPGSSHGGMGSSNELLDSFHSQYYVSSSVSDLEFREDHFAQQSAVGGTAHRWDSAENTYGLSDDSKLQRSPLRIRVRDAHVIWNLFDGYDWQRTRDTISKAVKDVEKKATERRTRTGSRASPGFEEEEESVIGDCLFNSIYIGIPANKDPRELRGDINRNIDDLISETGSYATTTTVTGATARQGQPTSRRKLRLSRSKYHKMTFELKGICADLVVFPPDSGETQSSLDVRIKDLEIFDHVPTSTWKKFATYMHEVGEKESGTSMIHLEILTVRPVPELAAAEIVLKATILPLRLHVDQDALDFLCRFFEFRDDSAPTPSAPEDIPFLQRAEINAVPVRLDFKPKRVDYAGLRSGRTTEFMNFFVLDGADMVMRHVIIYGVSGFDKLGQTLNDIWMPDIKRNQLPGVIAGLAPIRSLANVGGGMKDLVFVPMREYRKDGRIVRSIQKGAVSFAKTTSNELVKLGAKLAIGTQTVLQGAEDLLTTPRTPLAASEEDMMDEEEAKKISLYADQPVGVVQGLRGAFKGLERDLILTRDAIVAVPGEVVESGSAKAAAKAVWKRAPTVILRPAIGVSKAVGQTLLGAGNTLDPSNRRKMEDKYKRH
ncbi:autophagy- protein 2 [Aspergillus melleus]|uniref:Autophagy- protein 2 n=1 Tax=Aspergillus melleus TaxID=138277 RepID=A0ACC3BAS6_9EURO|nr:autophagy- protein 2 [Aspergillus melleus]